jgi:putative two-component system response regulator
MEDRENKLISEIQALQDKFTITTNKLIKDVKRQDKIMSRSDKRQQQEYDELQLKLEEVKALQKEIEDTQKEVVFTMGAIGESRSKETGNHVKRVAEYTYLLAKYSGLPEKECEMLKQASPMHDIGKVAIPDAVLNKPGRFDEEERKIMDTHAQLGFDMLQASNRPLLKMAATVAYEHHEKWNGTGYPNKLAGENIHIYGRITALADVFDALGSARVYKPAWDDERIFKMFKEERGEHFDPNLIDIFFERLDEFLVIRDSMKDI